MKEIFSKKKVVEQVCEELDIREYDLRGKSLDDISEICEMKELILKLNKEEIFVGIGDGNIYVCREHDEMQICKSCNDEYFLEIKEELFNRYLDIEDVVSTIKLFIKKK